jgi:tetratricopeptide (TPR) repeat protein
MGVRTAFAIMLVLATTAGWAAEPRGFVLKRSCVLATASAGNVVLIAGAPVRVLRSDDTHSEIQVSSLFVTGDVAHSRLLYDRAYLNGVVASQFLIAPAQAVDQFSGEIQANPKAAASWLARSIALRERGEFKKAIDDASQSIAIHPTPQTFTFRGQTRGLNGQYGEALADFAAATHLNTEFTPAIVAKASLDVLRGEAAQAVREADAVLGVHAEQGDALLVRAVARLRLGEAEPALQDCDAYLKLDPAEPGAAEALLVRGEACLALGEIEQAIAALTGALKQSPTVRAYRCRGLAWLARNDGRRANSDFSNALNLGPEGEDAEELFYLRSLASQLLGLRLEEANDLTAAIRLARPVEGVELTSATSSAEAAQRVVSLDELLQARAEAYAASGFLDEALSDYQELIAGHADDSALRLAMARVLIDAKRAADALAQCDRVLRIDAANSGAFELRAAASLALGQSAAAIRDFTKAIELAPTREGKFSALWNRAVAWQQLGQTAKALADADAAAKLNPADAGIKLLRKRLSENGAR